MENNRSELPPRCPEQEGAGAKSFPWVNPWREEARRILQSVPCPRPPALRRSRSADWLFATDLPQCAAEAECRAFLCRMREAGWEGEILDGWIQLRKTPPPLPAEWFRGNENEESACLRILMERHPGDEDPGRAVWALMKAREEGPAAWEKACRQIHREIALRLRTGDGIPGLRIREIEAGDESSC